MLKSLVAILFVAAVTAFPADSVSQKDSIEENGLTNTRKKHLDSAILARPSKVIFSKKVEGEKNVQSRHVPDSVKHRLHEQNKDQALLQRLTALGNRMRSPGQIDSLEDVSEEDKDRLKRRYHILHPLD